MASRESVVSAKRPKAKPVPSWLVTKEWGLDEPRVSDKFATKGLSQADKGRGSVPSGYFGEQSSTSHAPTSSPKLPASEIIADGFANGRRPSHGNTDESSDPSMPHPFPGGMPRGIPNASSRAPPEYNASIPPSKPPPPPSTFPQPSPASTFDTDSSKVAAERKRSRLYSEISQPKIQISELRRLSMTGIPEDGRLRATTWKLLLGYLPRTTEEWEAEVGKRRAEYAKFREDLIFSPTEVMRRKQEVAAQRSWMRDLEATERAAERAGGEEEGEAGEAVGDADHPLSLTPHSVWHLFFEDSELTEQIDRDVRRTHPDIPFFNGPEEGFEAVQDCMRRLLFIFAKLNPGIRYVQGMNEVLAPLLYVFANDLDADTSAHAEPDAFFCFSILVGDFRDLFCQQLDNSSVGIRSTLGRLGGLLREQDYELWEHLEFVTKVNPQFYAFRWITLLLTQDFPFDTILRLWDSILGNSSGPMEIVLRICCAMLVCVRDRLLAGDFATNLKLLQKYPPIDLELIIRTAESFKL